MHIPAFCDTCGAVYRSGIVVARISDDVPADNRAVPCPVCDNRGRIPGGVFDFLRAAIVILAAPERNLHELTRLTEILSEATDKKLSSDAIVDAVRHELPGLAGVAELFPPAQAGLNSYISMTVALSVLIWGASSSADGAATITVEQAIDHIFNETSRAAEKLCRHLRPSARRNETCPCGSGKKYKRCCGRLPS
jgi:hypothetical protein